MHSSRKKNSGVCAVRRFPWAARGSEGWTRSPAGAVCRFASGRLPQQVPAGQSWPQPHWGPILSAKGARPTLPLLLLTVRWGDRKRPAPRVSYMVALKDFQPWRTEWRGWRGSGLTPAGQGKATLGAGGGAPQLGLEAGRGTPPCVIGDEGNGANSPTATCPNAAGMLTNTSTTRVRQRLKLPFLPGGGTAAWARPASGGRTRVPYSSPGATRTAQWPSSPPAPPPAPAVTAAPSPKSAPHLQPTDPHPRQPQGDGRPSTRGKGPRYGCPGWTPSHSCASRQTVGTANPPSAPTSKASLTHSHHKYLLSA